MSITTIAQNTPARIVAGVLGIAVAFSLAFGVVIAPVQAQSVSIETLLAQIAALQAQLLALQGGSSTTPAAGVCPYTWTRNLQVGANGDDVMKLQQFLNSSADTTVAASGAGSKGNETRTFGPATRAAVIKFQNKYAADVLTPVGLTTGTGFVGASSRAKLNALCATASPVTPTTPTTPTGSGLTVSAAAQPANTLAPASAARVPFTKFTVTAAADGDVVLNNVTVERTGLAANSNFSGVMLLDEQGVQVGNTRTLNSENRATVGEAVTIPRGTSKTFTVAANRSSSGNAGEVASFTVVAVNSTGTVTGSLPISGASHTINTSLAIGELTVDRGGLDPATSQNKEVGTTGYTFSSIRLTAGSQEKVYVKSIRWNQTGSASASSDLKNVVTVIDGTSYPTTVSADGKYYTSVFPGNGILIDKGFNKEVSVKGDIVSGSSRTVDFDIAKRADINVVGETYGYGILAEDGAGTTSSLDDAEVMVNDDPYYDAAQVTISTGSMTVSTWTGVSASNIAENQSNQTIAGFSVDVRGEAISVGQMIFNLYHVENSGTSVTYDDVDAVTLVDQNGSVLAGPVDATDGGVDAVNGTVTFSDTITFPVGVTNLTLKGKVSTDFDTNDTIAASTTPSSQWTTVTGQVTGNTITPSPASALTGPTMTVKSGGMSISVSSVPIAQTVIAGSNDFEFARYILDATASGEDLRVSSLPLAYDEIGSGAATDLTNCRLFDGSTQVTTGSNVKNPTAAASSTVFSFDGSGLVVSKGTAKTISLKCNVSSSASSAYYWGIDSGATFSGISGFTSGQSVTPSVTDALGQAMSASTGGSMSVALDANSPGYKIVSAGATGVELARIRFSAANEDIDLKQVALQLSSVASNTPVDLVNREVKLYTTEGTQVGTAIFPTGDNATSSVIATGSFRIPRDSSKVLVVKGDIAGISASGPLTASGDLLVVDYDGDNESGTNGTYGVGVSSGSNRVPTASDSASSGVRIMKGYPVLAKLSVPSTLLSNGSDRSLYRFSVTATNNDIALAKLSFDVSSSTVTATTTTYGLYAYTDSSFSTTDTTFSSTGIVNASNAINGLGTNSPDAAADAASPSIVEIYPDRGSATTTYTVPAGTTRYFELRATVENVESSTGSETITVALLGDAAFPTGHANLMLVAGTSAGSTGVDSDTNDDFIWSPISTSTSVSIADLDFTNGYQVPGLPSVQMSSETFTSAN